MAQAQGLLSLSFEIEVAHSGILFLDKLVQKDPEAMVIFSGNEGSVGKKIPLIFFEEESDELGFGLFDAIRKSTFDSFFPFFGLVEDRGGCVCLNFSEGYEQEENLS
jgi:hypothetical protein